MDLSTAIRARRSIKLFTGEAVDQSRVEALLTLATCAPTHHRTQPWRFYACDQATTHLIGQIVSTDPALSAVLDARKATKIRDLLSKVGAMVVITWVRHADPTTDREDLCAAAAAAQNLLLAATDAGLGSFWSTNPGLAHPSTLQRLGVNPDTEGFVGAIWLGTPTEQPEASPRLPLSERLRWVSLRS